MNTHIIIVVRIQLQINNVASLTNKDPYGVGYYQLYCLLHPLIVLWNDM